MTLDREIDAMVTKALLRTDCAHENAKIMHRRERLTGEIKELIKKHGPSQTKITGPERIK